MENLKVKAKTFWNKHGQTVVETALFGGIMVVNMAIANKLGYMDGYVTCLLDVAEAANKDK